MKDIDLTKFLEIITNLFETTSLFKEEGIYVEILFNPASGVFQEKSFKKKVLPLLEAYRKKNQYIQKRTNVDVNCVVTKSKLHAEKEAILAVERLVSRKERVKLLVSAGGDGFHKDVGMSIVQKSPKLFEEFILLRLPMGTGNDTSDAADLSEVFKILSGEGQIKKGSYLTFSARNLSVNYAFNVISFGLDAYVCALTEKWKRKVKGDIYKFMVDVSTLLYDFRYKTHLMKVVLDDKKRGPVEFSDRHVLTVMGTEGHTTYGGKKKILPGKENFLAAHVLSIARKIKLKSLFMTGRHIDLPGVSLYETERIVIDYPGEILVELDGEVVLLQKDNFPVLMERKKDAINILTL